MSRFWKTVRWFVVVGSGLFIVAQFFGPAKTNPPLDQALTLQSSAHVTPQVASILDRSCNDCHSNNTRWPWYSNVAPVSWFVIDHVNEGRQDMNFSEWGGYDERRRTGQLNQICREVKSGAMPLGSYTPLHRGSKLTPDDVKTLCDWATAERSRMSDML